MVNISIGSIIYTAVRPIFKIYLIISCGFWLGKKNILTVDTCKQLSTIIVTLILPNLVFDKVVNNITNADIKQIGILVLVSFFLYGIGGLCSVLIYYATRTPSAWFGGCLSAGLFPNVAELPIAYVSTLGSIFSDEEVEKGISYVIIFLATYCLIQFNFGAIMLIEMDYTTQETQDRGGQRLDSTNEAANSAETSKSKTDNSLARISTSTSFESRRSNNIELRRRPPQGMKEVIEDYQKEELTFTKIKSTLKSKFKPYIFLKFFFANCKRPISISLIVSLTISMIPWVQALFVSTTQYQFPNAPDGQPPLSFIMNFTGYLSQACVPLGLLILGATLSRIKIDRSNMDRSTIITPLALGLVRLVIIPIIGILFISRLKKDGWFDDDRILLFVCCISFGLPCATSLIYLTASFSSGEDVQMRYLSSVYVVQYPMLAISLPFLTTYTVMKMLD